MRTIRRSLSALVGVTALAVVALVLMQGRPGDLFGAGSTEPPKATFVPAATATTIALPALDPDSPPLELASECEGHLRVSDGPTETLEHLSLVSGSVVVARISEVGISRWNTPMERPPTDDLDVHAGSVVRLARVDVTDVLKGESEASITVACFGGSIGCHTFRVEGQPDPMPGAEVVLFLSAKPIAMQLDGVSTFTKALTVEGGKVVTPEDGTVSLSGLREAVASPEYGS